MFLVTSFSGSLSKPRIQLEGTHHKHEKQSNAQNQCTQSNFRHTMGCTSLSTINGLQGSYTLGAGLGFSDFPPT